MERVRGLLGLFAVEIDTRKGMRTEQVIRKQMKIWNQSSCAPRNPEDAPVRPPSSIQGCGKEGAGRDGGGWVDSPSRSPTQV